FAVVDGRVLGTTLLVADELPSRISVHSCQARASASASGISAGFQTAQRRSGSTIWSCTAPSPNAVSRTHSRTVREAGGVRRILPTTLLLLAYSAEGSDGDSRHANMPSTTAATTTSPFASSPWTVHA